MADNKDKNNINEIASNVEDLNDKMDILYEKIKNASALNQTIEEIGDSVEDVNDKLDSIDDKLSKNNDKVIQVAIKKLSDNLVDEFEQISDGVNDLGDKLDLIDDKLAAGSKPNKGGKDTAKINQSIKQLSDNFGDELEQINDKLDVLYDKADTNRKVKKGVSEISDDIAELNDKLDLIYDSVEKIKSEQKKQKNSADSTGTDKKTARKKKETEDVSKAMSLIEHIRRQPRKDGKEGFSPDISGGFESYIKERAYNRDISNQEAVAKRGRGNIVENAVGILFNKSIASAMSKLFDKQYTDKEQKQAQKEVDKRAKANNKLSTKKNKQNDQTGVIEEKLEQISVDVEKLKKGINGIQKSAKGLAKQFPKLSSTIIKSIKNSNKEQTNYLKKLHLSMMNKNIEDIKNVMEEKFPKDKVEELLADEADEKEDQLKHALYKALQQVFEDHPELLSDALYDSGAGGGGLLDGVIDDAAACAMCRRGTSGKGGKGGKGAGAGGTAEGGGTATRKPSSIKSGVDKLGRTYHYDTATGRRVSAAEAAKFKGGPSGLAAGELAAKGKFTKAFTKVGGIAGKALLPLGVGLSIYEGYTGYSAASAAEQAGEISHAQAHAQKGQAIGSAAGGLAGGAGGGALGAAIGTALLPGVGTIIGGLLGAYLGAEAGSAVGGVTGGMIGGATAPQPWDNNNGTYSGGYGGSGGRTSGGNLFTPGGQYTGSASGASQSRPTGGSAGTGGGSSSTVQIKNASGEVVEERTGGNINWRNNNPGNIRYGEFAQKHGAIGENGGFAVFVTKDDGRKAQDALLRTQQYSNLTLAQAIAKWAPVGDNNDPVAYANSVGKNANLDVNRKYKDLNSAEQGRFLDAMERVEGGAVGKVTAGPGKATPGHMTVATVKSSGSAGGSTTSSTTNTSSGGAPGGGSGAGGSGAGSASEKTDYGTINHPISPNWSLFGEEYAKFSGTKMYKDSKGTWLSTDNKFKATEPRLIHTFDNMVKDYNQSKAPAEMDLSWMNKNKGDDGTNNSTASSTTASATPTTTPTPSTTPSATTSTASTPWPAYVPESNNSKQTTTNTPTVTPTANTTSSTATSSSKKDPVRYVAGQPLYPGKPLNDKQFQTLRTAKQNGMQLDPQLQKAYDDYAKANPTANATATVKPAASTQINPSTKTVTDTDGTVFTFNAGANTTPAATNTSTATNKTQTTSKPATQTTTKPATTQTTTKPATTQTAAQTTTTKPATTAQTTPSSTTQGHVYDGNSFGKDYNASDRSMQGKGSVTERADAAAQAAIGNRFKSGSAGSAGSTVNNNTTVTNNNTTVNNTSTKSKPASSGNGGNGVTVSGFNLADYKDTKEYKEAYKEAKDDVMMGEGEPDPDEREMIEEFVKDELVMQIQLGTLKPRGSTKVSKTKDAEAVDAISDKIDAEEGDKSAKLKDSSGGAAAVTPNPKPETTTSPETQPSAPAQTTNKSATNSDKSSKSSKATNTTSNGVTVSGFNLADYKDTKEYKEAYKEAYEDEMWGEEGEPDPEQRDIIEQFVKADLIMKIQNGEMEPKGSTKVSKTKDAQAVDAIEKQIDKSPPNLKPDSPSAATGETNTATPAAAKPASSAAPASSSATPAAAKPASSAAPASSSATSAAASSATAAAAPATATLKPESSGPDVGAAGQNMDPEFKKLLLSMSDEDSQRGYAAWRVLMNPKESGTARMGAGQLLEELKKKYKSAKAPTSTPSSNSNSPSLKPQTASLKPADSSTGSEIISANRAVEDKKSDMEQIKNDTQVAAINNAAGKGQTVINNNSSVSMPSGEGKEIKTQKDENTFNRLLASDVDLPHSAFNIA